MRDNDYSLGCPGGSVGKESTCNAGDTGDEVSIPRSERSPGEAHGNPLQYFCLENSHGQRSLVGYSPCGVKELDMTERLRTAQRARFNVNLLCQNFLMIPYSL